MLASLRSSKAVLYGSELGEVLDDSSCHLGAAGCGTVFVGNGLRVPVGAWNGVGGGEGLRVLLVLVEGLLGSCG